MSKPEASSDLPNKSETKLQAWALLIVLAIIWGSSFILIKRAVIGLSPIHVASLRVLAASIVFLPFSIRSLRQIPRARLKYFLMAGCIGNLAPSFLFAISMPYMESTVSGILNSLAPLFTLITGAIIWRHKFSYSKILGVLVGFGGCLVLIAFRGNSFDLNINYYALMVVLATFFYGLNTNILKSFFSDVKPIQFASISFLMIGPIAGTIFFATNGWESIWVDQASINAAGYTIVLAVSSSALALVLFTKLIQMTSAIFSASVTYLMPVVSIFWGVWDNEEIGLVQISGTLIILIGIFLVRK